MGRPTKGPVFFLGHADFFLDALPALVTMTRQNFRREHDVATDNFRVLTQQRVRELLAHLQARRWNQVSPWSVPWLYRAVE
jgi:hypothetical protein